MFRGHLEGSLLDGKPSRQLVDTVPRKRLYVKLSNESSLLSATLQNKTRKGKSSFLTKN